VNEATQMLTLQFGASFQGDRVSTWQLINCWEAIQRICFWLWFHPPLSSPLSIDNHFSSGILL